MLVLHTLHPFRSVTNYLSRWSRLLLEKLMCPQLEKTLHSPHFMGTEVTSSCLLQPAICQWRELHQSIHVPILFSEDPF
jgi:hypothetical protein